MKKQKKVEQLSFFEETLLWMAIRYAMNRSTIASATLPADIIKNWHPRLCENQKRLIVTDLKRNLEDLKERAFGDPEIDKPAWMKFMYALDSSCHKKAILIDDTEETVFLLGDEYIPLNSYLEFPHRNIFIPKENIKKFYD